MLQSRYFNRGVRKGQYVTEIMYADLPRYVDIPMQQSIGSAAIPTVKVGDTVQEGDLIGRASGFLSTQVHSSIQGVVRDVYKGLTFHGLETECVRIELSMQFHGIIGDAVYKTLDWGSLGSDALLTQIHNAGLVDIEEHVIPLHAKLKAAQAHHPSTLIINGLFPEPLVNASWPLFLQYGKEIVEGIEILQKVLGVESAVLVLPKYKYSISEELQRLCDEKGIAVQKENGKSAYTERLFVEQVSGQKVSWERLPLHYGIFVCHISSVYALYQAMVLRRPMTRQIISISDSRLQRTFHYQARIGTSLGHLLEECEFNDPSMDMILGGYMKGYCLSNRDQALTKDMHTLILVPKVGRKEEELACIRCGLCIDVCPVSLTPVSLYEAIQAGEQIHSEIDQCIECGHCSFICPSRISLTNSFIEARKNMRRQKFI